MIIDIHVPAWMGEAVCAQTDPEVFSLRRANHLGKPSVSATAALWPLNASDTA